MIDNINKLLHNLNNYPWHTPVFIHVGYNRFNIQKITNNDGYILIHVEEDANNPSPPRPFDDNDIA
jgi:hypothetical protein